MRLLIAEPFVLPNSEKSLYFPCSRKNPPQFPKMKLMTCLVSGNCMKALGFRQKLQKLSCNHGKTEQDSDTTLSYITQWFAFCGRQCINPTKPDIAQVLNVLHGLFIKNVGYSVINTARSALSSFINIDGYNVGRHPMVCRFLKGINNIKPSLTKYVFTWDVGSQQCKISVNNEL